MQYQTKQITCYAVFILVLFALSGCAQVQLVADYDKELQNDTFVLAKRVDLFWANYIDAVGKAREYNAIKKEMIAIEVEMNSLLLKNQARAINRESTKQVGNLIKTWTEVSKLIKTQGSISNSSAKASRLQLADIMKYIVIGEKAKNISANNNAATPITTYAYRNYTFIEGSK